MGLAHEGTSDPEASPIEKQGELTSAQARREFKFVFDELDHAWLTHWLRSSPDRLETAFPARHVHNAYFDSVDLFAYRENLSGTSYRRKYRVRWYGNREPSSEAVLESKVKRARLGWKESCTLQLLEPFGAYSWGEHKDSWLPQLKPGKRWELQYRQPVLLCGYRREYYATPCNRLRVTTDRHHYCFDQRFAIHPSWLTPIPVPSPLVVEVKVAAVDTWLAEDLLQRMPARLSRHSKYAVNLANSMVSLT